MRITLDTTISIEKNAALYFERAKKAKKKAEGARKALEHTKSKLAQEEQQEQVREHRVKRAQRKRDWYEKFRWFISSDGFLCVGGRDASTNDALVKKHTLPHDIVFHTDMAGSPFCVVQSEGKEIPDSTKEEAAIFTASFSRAWKEGLGSLEVFYVKPDQLSKTAEAGEYVSKGAFMVRGHVEYLRPTLGVSVGKEESGRIMVGPETAVLKSCGVAYQIIQGTEKTSDVAKRLAKILEVPSDDIVPLLPAGGVKLGRRSQNK